MSETQIVNLAFNELSRYKSLSMEKDSLIALKNKKIENLIKVEQIRAEQLIYVNSKNMELTKQNKTLQRKLILHKVLLIGAGVVVAWVVLFPH